MALVLVTILLPIAAAALLLLLPRDDKTLSRVIGTLVAVVTFATVIAAGTAQWSARWLSRPFDAAFHFGATPISFWLALLLDALHGFARSPLAVSSARAISSRCSLRSKGRCSGFSSRAICSSSRSSGI